MLNQFGQDIQVGDWVGWASKTGSYTTRKIGRVTGFGERKDWAGRKMEDTADVDWQFDGSSANPARAITVKGKSNGVGINRLFKLDQEFAAGF